MRILRRTVLATLVGLSVACAPPPPAPASAAAASPAPAPAAPASFVNRVWRVADSNAVAAGQLYVFLSEGTLVIAAPTGTPSLGTWSRDGDGLTIVEEGRPHRVEVLNLTHDEWRVRVHSPGEPVDIRLVPAGDGPDAPALRR